MNYDEIDLIKTKNVINMIIYTDFPIPVADEYNTMSPTQSRMTSMRYPHIGFIIFEAHIQSAAAKKSLGSPHKETR